MRLFWKELRECARTLPLAFVVFALVWWFLLPSRSVYGGQFDINSANAAALLGCVYSLLLGVLQAWPLQRIDVRGWLFSQPVSRRRVYWTQTLAAVVVYMAAMIVPYCVTYWYLRTYLPAMSPIEPNAFLAAGVAYLYGFIMHPAAIWMLSRPAKWVGSKSFTLALPIGIFMLPMAAIYTPFTWLFTSALLLLGIVGTVSIFGVAEDAFTASANMPPRWRSDTLASRWLRRSGAVATTIAVVIAVWTACGVIVSLAESILRSPETHNDGAYHAYRFQPDGDIARVKIKSEYDPKIGTLEKILAAYELPATNDLAEAKALRKVADDSQPNTDQEYLQTLREGHFLRDINYPVPFRLFGQIEEHNETASSDGVVWYRHADGYVLGYVHDYNNSREPLLRKVMDRSGLGSTNVPFGRSHVAQLPLHSLTGFSIAQHTYLFDNEGVYDYDSANQKLDVLLEQPIDSAAIFERLGGHGWTLYTRDGLTVSLFDVLPVDETTALPESPTGLPIGFTPELLWAKTKLVLRQTIELPASTFEWADLPKNWSQAEIVDLGNDSFQLVQWRSRVGMKTLRINDSGVIADSEKTYVWPRVRPAPLSSQIPVVLVPPVLAAISIGFGIWQATFGSPDTVTTTVEWILAFTLLLIHAGWAWWLTRWACLHRNLNDKHTLTWKLVSLALGIVVPAIVLCVHERVAVQVCLECENRIRVDELACSACGASHAETPPLGIEIMAR